jgi:hypothetical protein
MIRPIVRTRRIAPGQRTKAKPTRRRNNNNGQMIGTAIGRTATITGGGGFHCDEALGALPAPSASTYQYVSWAEDIR